MAEPIITPDDESKKDTVRINLPPNAASRLPSPLPKAVSEQAKHDTAPVGSDQAKKETSMMGMPPAAGDSQAKKQTMLMGSPIPPSEAKKETSRVAVPSVKPAVPEMPRPTVRLRRDAPSSPASPQPAAPAPASGVAPATAPVQVPPAGTPSAKPPVPEMPRPTVKLKVEEPAPTAAPTAAPTPVAVSTSAPVEASLLDAVLSLGAAVVSVAALVYIASVAMN